MKKLLFLVLTLFVLVSCSDKTVKKENVFIGMPNPWTDCGTDLNQAAEIAGFTFPLSLSNYDVRAMKDIIEINFPLDEQKTVCVRKTTAQERTNNGDISGVYTKYPIDKAYMLKNSIPLRIKGNDENEIYVVNIFGINSYYSIYCQKGMELKDVEKIYHIITEAEPAALHPQKIK